ncbi:MAG: MFS transporter [Nostoc sp.]|uniref:MFS transporter n=1 Tax=unclassified Nostoc TaxID=2593658 RepID=UPI001DEA92F0|nr:MFS transporter [Nostoc sp. JL34]MBN3882101.1 MFS transporter [Nostoc sp. JL34]
MLNSEIQKDLRHNFTVNIIESGFFGFGISTPLSAIETKREFWDNLSVILRCDGNFRYFVSARMLSQLALMPLPFYTLYAVHQYGMEEASVGLITSLLMVTQTIAGLVLGWVGDRTGYKLVLQTGCVACTFSSVLAWLAPNANWFYLVFIGAGIGMVALQNIAAVNDLRVWERAPTTSLYWSW